VSAVEIATIEKIYPTRIWIESDFWGSRHVMIQHEGVEAFTYATFFYDHRYTCNSFTMSAATACATRLGAAEPIEHRHRGVEEVIAQLQGTAQPRTDAGGEG
jgi:hypothetical protein